MGTGWFCSCTLLVTPELQQQFGDRSKIILSLTGMEVCSLDPCISQFWHSQHSLAGSSAGRSIYFCLLCLFVLESQKQSMVCVVWALSLSLDPHQWDISVPWAFCPAWSSGCSLWSLPASPSVLTILPTLCSSSGKNFHWDIPPNLFFFANPQRLGLIHYPCLRSDSSW